MSNANAEPKLDFDFKNTRLDHIPLSKIRENQDALRDTVDKSSEEYQLNLDSVKKRGIMKPILVREIKDPATGELLYGLIDGLHRFNWAMDAGFAEIPASIGSLEDGDLLEAQIIANVHRVETKAVQYTKALLRIMGSNPLLTAIELAARISQSVSWLNQRLSLIKLKPEYQTMVNDGTLGLTNAYALAKLPHEEQVNLIDQALAQSPAEFLPTADRVKRELAQARRQARTPDTGKFEPAARLQRLATIKTQQELALKTPDACTVILQAKQNGVQTVEQAIAYALNWTLHLDPESVKTDEAAWNAKKLENARKKAQEIQKKAEETQQKAKQALEAAGMA